MMDKLEYLERQMLQYQATNPFGAGMTKVIESKISNSDWDRQTQIDQPGQNPGSYVYWATLQLDFINAGDFKPPYMILVDAMINEIDIYKYPWYGEVPYTYAHPMATCAIESPFQTWIPELNNNHLEFFTVATAYFPHPPNLKYKIKIYCPFEVNARILYERKYEKGR